MFEQSTLGNSSNPSLVKISFKSASDFRHTCGREVITIQCLKCGCYISVGSGSRDRTCSACAKWIYERRVARFEKAIENRKNLKLLTLTWKPVPKQDPLIVRAIGRAVTKLLHRKRYVKAWKGVLAVLECKETKYGWFYYHVHILLFGAYIPQKQISKDWREISRFSVVDIRRVWRTPLRALRYVLKYILKGFSFKDPKNTLDFKSSMKGVHYVRSYGEFYNYQYRSARHVYFPCPQCGEIKAWIVLDFQREDIPMGVPWDPYNNPG